MILPENILEHIDEIILTMRPRFTSSSLSMDGKYPCWIVWLPNEGTTSRKTLKQAILDYADQANALKP
jgi:hypothetical protein